MRTDRLKRLIGCKKSNSSIVIYEVEDDDGRYPKPILVNSFGRIVPESRKSLMLDHCILDFYISCKYLIATGTDFKVRFIDIRSGKLELESITEGKLSLTRHGHICLFLRRHPRRVR